MAVVVYDITSKYCGVMSSSKAHQGCRQHNHSIANRMYLADFNSRGVERLPIGRLCFAKDSFLFMEYPLCLMLWSYCLQELYVRCKLKPKLKIGLKHSLYDHFSEPPV